MTHSGFCFKQVVCVCFTVKLLFDENRALDEANERLLCLLEKEQKHRSERKHSASNSNKVKAPTNPTIKAQVFTDLILFSTHTRK